jgi:hypothetical protein
MNKFSFHLDLFYPNSYFLFLIHNHLLINQKYFCPSVTDFNFNFTFILMAQLKKVVEGLNPLFMSVEGAETIIVTFLERIQIIFKHNSTIRRGSSKSSRGDCALSSSRLVTPLFYS